MTVSAVRAWWQHHQGRAHDVLLMALTILGASVIVIGAAVGEPGVQASTWWSAGLTLAVVVGLWWRRRAPLLLVLAASAAVVAGASGVTLVVTLVTLAVRHRDRRLALGSAVAAAAYFTTALRLPALPQGHAWVAALANTVLTIGLPVAVGAYVGARRELVRTLRERAERAEAEQALRGDQARLSERTRIAQEMHDVLAHRISLVALHAGGLEVNPAAGPEAVERSAALIRTTARSALEDLRGVLGVLRADTTAGGEDLLPQPTLADVERLVSSSAQAGVAVRLDDALPPGAAPPPLLGRTAYRVVQEGLTNVHKHAPAAAAAVRLSGAPGEGLEVEVRNARPVGRDLAPLVPGAGLGLVGLRERVELAGGVLEAGAQPDGGFAVHARLPWPAQALEPAVRA